MSIFGQRKPAAEAVTEGLVNIDTGFIEGSSSSLQEILTESSAEMYKHSASYYISDIIMTESVMEGVEVEPLMENFVKNAWERLKKIFNMLWAKVRKWFESAKSAIKLIFLSGEKFVKEFKGKITAKDAAGFTYNGYEYTISKGESVVKSKRDIISSFLDTEVNFSVSEAQKDVTNVNRSGEDAHGQEDIIRGSKTGASYNESEVKSKLRVKLGNEEFSEVLKQVRKEFHNGKDAAAEITGIEKDMMMSFITSNAGNLKGVEDAQKQMDADFKQILSSIDKAKASITSSKETEQEKARLTTFATHKYNVAHYGLTLQQSLSNTLVQAYREAGRNFESTLKSFLRFKPAKEGFGDEEVELDEEEGDNKEGNTGDDNVADESILESAQRWL